MDEVIKLYPRVDKKEPLHTPMGMKGMEEVRITQDFLAKIIKSQENGKGVGLSGLSGEVIKAMWKNDKVVRESLTKTINHLVNHPEEIHEQFFTAKLVCIPKEKGGLRPIVLEETIYKIMSKAVSTLLTEQIANKIHKNQFCLRTSNSQLLAVNKVRSYIDKGYDKIVSIDFTNAYGLVDRGHIVSELQKYGVNVHLISFLGTSLERQKVAFFDRGGELQILPIERGVLQGNACSTALFCVGVNKLLETFHCKQLKVVAYADDFVLMARDIKTLEQAWTGFTEAARRVGMSINTTKTRVLLPERVDKDTSHLGLQTCFYNHGDKWTYLGLPITKSKTTIEEDLQEKLDSFVQTASLLWTSRVPLQTRYHLYQMCLMRKLVYYFRGTLFETRDATRSRYILKQADKRLLSVLPAVFRDVDPIIRDTPFRYGGLNMTRMEDLALICRHASDIALGHVKPKDIPILKGVDAREVTQELVHKRFFQDKVFNSKIQGRLENEEYFNTRTLLLRSPPSAPKQFLEDIEFTLYIDQLADTDHTAPTLFQDITECPVHPGKECNTQHSLCCTVGWNQVVRCHNDIVAKVMSILARNRDTSNRKFENYTESQLEYGTSKGRRKRADITYYMGGRQHSVDVCIMHKRLNQGKKVNAIKAGIAKKRTEYEGELNIHLVVADSEGNIAEETQKYLTSIGARNSDFKDIVSIIIKRMASKLESVRIHNSKAWKERNARRGRRRRHKEQAETNNNSNQDKQSKKSETKATSKQSLEQQNTQTDKEGEGQADKQDAGNPHLVSG